MPRIPSTLQNAINQWQAKPCQAEGKSKLKVNCLRCTVVWSNVPKAVDMRFTCGGPMHSQGKFDCVQVDCSYTMLTLVPVSTGMRCNAGAYCVKDDHDQACLCSNMHAGIGITSTNCPGSEGSVHCPW